jgi:hypothetical protein
LATTGLRGRCDKRLSQNRSAGPRIRWFAADLAASEIVSKCWGVGVERRMVFGVRLSVVGALVPTLCVGTTAGTLRVHPHRPKLPPASPFPSAARPASAIDAERRKTRSDAEHRNEREGTGSEVFSVFGAGSSRLGACRLRLLFALGARGSALAASFPSRISAAGRSSGRSACRGAGRRLS